MRSHNLVKGER